MSAVYRHGVSIMFSFPLCVRECEWTLLGGLFAGGPWLWGGLCATPFGKAQLVAGLGTKCCLS